MLLFFGFVSRKYDNEVSTKVGHLGVIVDSGFICHSHFTSGTKAHFYHIK